MSNSSPEQKGSGSQSTPDIVARFSDFILTCLKTPYPSTPDGRLITTRFTGISLEVSFPDPDFDTISLNTQYTDTSRAFPQRDYNYLPVHHSMKAASLRVRTTRPQQRPNALGMYGRHLAALQHRAGIFTIAPQSKIVSYIPGWELTVFKPKDVGRFTKMGGLLQLICEQEGIPLASTEPTTSVLIDDEFNPETNHGQYHEPDPLSLIDKVKAILPPKPEV